MNKHAVLDREQLSHLRDMVLALQSSRLKGFSDEKLTLLELTG